MCYDFIMWLLFQGTIIFLVVASNIQWQWTPNGYLAAGLGIAAAFGATQAINSLLEWRQRARKRPWKRPPC